MPGVSQPNIIEWVWLYSNQTFISKKKEQARLGLWARDCQPPWYGDVLLMIFTSIFKEGKFPFLKCLCQVLKLALYWPHWTSAVAFPLQCSDRVCVRLIFFSYLNDGIYQWNYLDLSIFSYGETFFFL